MTALVVGGAGAIGSAVVSRLEGAGKTVYSLDAESGIDASDPRSVGEFLDGIPPVTSLVHAAGSVSSGGWEASDLTSWNGIIKDNLTSAYVTCRAVLPSMLERGGAIVLVSSVNGRSGGNPMSGPAYAAAKAGVLALARNLMKEFGSRGIRANAIAPGPVASRMTDRLSTDEMATLLSGIPAGRIAAPDEIAAAITYLLSADASYINGAVLDINGGMWSG